MNAGFLVLLLLTVTGPALGREKWLERGDKAVFLHPRRFGQENPAVLQKLRGACSGGVCDTLAGQAVTPLLAAQPECSQQDMADAIIDTSRQFDAATQAKMIAIAKEYRQAEKNTPPDFSTNPPTLRNSVFCQKAPKNEELAGLVQAQDPANDPETFFDPATKSSVKRGTQPNTSPFGNGATTISGNGNGGINANNRNTGGGAKGRNGNNRGGGGNAKGNNRENNGDNDDDDGDEGEDNNTDVPSRAPASAPGKAPAPTVTAVRAEISQPPSGCPTAVTITVSATNPAASVMNAITVTVNSPPKTTEPAPAASGVPNGADFGSCTTPEIEFGTGFDNRRETSFQPADKASYTHGSAQNVNIITQFICDSLTNTCKANQAAKDLCSTARTAASSAKTGTGAQADAFNSVFGIQTKFVDIPSVDNQGKVIPGTGTGNDGNGNGNGNGNGESTTRAPGPATLTAASPAATSAASGTIGNFGSCSTPEIEFGVGFDNRRETSFRPVDLTSFNHGSAQNIAIITDFMCDELTNSCKADQTAKDTCARAVTAAANANPKGSGAQADAFNAIFGIQTNFVNVQQLDDQGRPVGSSGRAPPTQAPVTTAPRSTSTAPPPATATAPPQNTGTSLQTFTGSLGGVRAPAVRDLGNGRFAVDGNSQFNDKGSALARSCDVQNNGCADAANGSGNKNGFTVQACNQQQAQCKATAGA